MLRTLEERQIRFVRLWFTDILGYLKSVAIAPAELEGAFAEGIGFDGSAIEGFARASESDMLARPDPSTFQVLPDVVSGHADSARIHPEIEFFLLQGICPATVPRPSLIDQRRVTST